MKKFIFSSKLKYIDIVLTKNKSLEIEWNCFDSNPEYHKLELSFRWQPKKNHSGPEFNLEIFNYFSFRVKIYDHRHWDLEKDSWQLKK